MYNSIFFTLCRAEKTSKLQTIPGTLDIAVDYIPLEHPSMFLDRTFSFFLLLSSALCSHALFLCAFRLRDILLCAGEAF